MVSAIGFNLRVKSVVGTPELVFFISKLKSFFFFCTFLKYVTAVATE